MSTTVKSPTAEELRSELTSESRPVFSAVDWALIGDQLGNGAISQPGDVEKLDSSPEK